MEYEEAMAREALRRLAIYKNNNEKARRTGISEGTWRKWLRGEFPPFRGDTRPKLDKFLGLEGLSVEEATARLEEFRARAISAVEAEALRRTQAEQEALEEQARKEGQTPDAEKKRA